ncbi:MAG: cobamide remodeling phosphodiesterase CbiR [Thermodesulfobacteriota bacterium]
MKGRFPWRLGATSFVRPAGVEENVRFLAPLVDDVQLLFFESQSRARLPHAVDIPLLAQLAAEHDLSYTVHLPLDLRLAAADEGRRQADLAEICRLVGELSPLNPLAFDLHLNLEGEMALAEWQANISRSLAQLAAELGEWQALLAVENIDYDPGIFSEVAAGAGCSFCLDFGHLLRYGHGPGRLRPDCNHVHLHGVKDGRDHQALAADPWLAGVLRELARVDFQGVVTVELYKEELLRLSLAALAAAEKKLI